MPITDEINRLILTGGNAIDIADQAKAEGVLDLRQAGLLKVKAGMTSLEEVLAVHQRMMLVPRMAGARETRRTERWRLR